MESLPLLQTLVTALVLLLACLEAWVLRRYQPGAFDAAQAAMSLGDMLGRRLLALLPWSLTAPLWDWLWQHRLFTLELQAWPLYILLWLGLELCYYAYHRASHRVRFLWASHAVHHSPSQLNLFAAFRLGWTGPFTGTFLFFTPLVLLGFRPQLVLAALSLNLLYQLLLHTTWIPRMGWLEYVFNTPSSHRVHHASNQQYLDANFGGTLVLFDRLFGSYRAERADDPCVYGLTKPMVTRNLFTMEFMHWRALWRALQAAQRWQDRLALLLRPPASSSPVDG